MRGEHAEHPDTDFKNHHPPGMASALKTHGQV